MRVGFTGTRKGLSPRQREQLRFVLRELIPRADGDPFEFHHGCAVGADTEACAVAVRTGYVEIPHPAAGDPLARNREIVAACDVLIAAPETDEEQLRSGTWATVRYARQAGKPVVMLSRGEA